VIEAAFFESRRVSELRVNRWHQRALVGLGRVAIDYTVSNVSG
jgi:hypothetical protein